MSEPKKIEPVMERNCQVFEHTSTVWDLRADAGTTLDHLLDPGYWRNLAHLLKPLHEIRVVSKDFKLYALLLVSNVITGIAAGQLPQASMVVLMAKDLSKQKVTVAKETDYEIKYHSEETKYGIFRRANNDMIQGGFNDEAAAVAGLKAYLAKLATPVAA